MSYITQLPDRARHFWSSVTLRHRKKYDNADMRLGKAVATAIMSASLVSGMSCQMPKPSSISLTDFDNEHDLAKKERLLREITQDQNVGDSLMRLAASTKNADTRWMAMRGMRDVHCLKCIGFLEKSLKDEDPLARANAVRVLGDLGAKASSQLVLKMFISESDPGAIEQASLTLRVFDMKSACPYIREKVPRYSGQTRAWLLQALGSLGSKTDVPFVAGYLNSENWASAEMAARALEELTGVDFGPRPSGPYGYPPPDLVRARAWWALHEATWPDPPS